MSGARSSENVRKQAEMMENRKRNFMTYLLPAGSPGQKIFVLLPVLLVVLLLFPETAATGGIHKKAGTTGFPFLKLWPMIPRLYIIIRPGQ